METITGWLQVIGLCFGGYLLGSFIYNKAVTYVKNTYDKNINNGYVKFYVVVCSIAAIGLSLEYFGVGI